MPSVAFKQLITKLIFLNNRFMKKNPTSAKSTSLQTILVYLKGPIHDQKKNSQYFEAKNRRPIFDKIFDAILPTHVPSKFRSKFIVLKMFDPDAAVAVAPILANVHLRTEFLIKILTGAQTRVKILKRCQNIDDWSKYIKQI